MLLLSAFEDFVNRTLLAIPGKLGKLRYLGSLRRQGEYQHWGLTRVHGPAAAADAMAEAHAGIWLDVLRTPIPDLHSEWQALKEDIDDRNARWFADPGALVPRNMAGGTQQHFNSILLALSLLSKKAKQRNPRAA